MSTPSTTDASPTIELERAQLPMTGPELETQNYPSGQGEDLSTSSRPQCNRRPPSHLKDFVCHVIEKIDLVTSPLQDAFSGTPYPLTKFISYDRFSSSHHALLAPITCHDEPKTFIQAAEHPQWREAMTK